MPSVWTQTKGVAKFGPTAGTVVDYSSAVTSVDLEFEAGQNDVPATLATGETGYEPGAKARNLALNFLSEGALTSLFTEFETAFEAASGEGADVFFEVTLKQGATSATNPKFTGRIFIDAVSIGGNRNTVRSQSRTYKIRSGSYVRAIA